MSSRPDIQILENTKVHIHQLKNMKEVNRNQRHKELVK